MTKIDHTKIHEIARATRLREYLYENAWDHLQETGDREGARIYLNYARPRNRAVRSPHDWLEWVDNVLAILADREMAAEGIREAENCARGELMQYFAMWDYIVIAWLRIGDKESARAALLEGEADSSGEELTVMAALWVDAFHDTEQARQVLALARTKLLSLKKNWEEHNVRLLSKIAAAWLNILGDWEEYEKDFQAAEDLAINARSWLSIAEAYCSAGLLDGAYTSMKKAEQAAVAVDEITCLAYRYEEHLDDKEAALRVLALGEGMAKGYHDWSILQHAYQCLRDPEGEERCRTKMSDEQRR